MVDIYSIMISSPFKMFSSCTMLTIQRISKLILSYYSYYVFTTVYTDVVIAVIFMLWSKKHFMRCIEWRLMSDLKKTLKEWPCCHTHHEEINLQRIVSQKPQEKWDCCSKMHVAWSLTAVLAALKNVLTECGWKLGSGFSSSLAVPALPSGCFINASLPATQCHATNPILK